MQYMNGVLQTVLPVIVVILIGSIVRSKQILSAEGIAALKKVAINIALPAVLINAFATTSYSARNILIPLVLFAVCLLAWFLGKLVRKLFRLQDPFLPYLTTGFEAGMLGYTLYTMLYGSESVASFAMVDLGQVLFVFTIYKILLGREVSKQEGSGILRSMLTSPIIIAIIVGVAIGATGLYGVMETVGISPIFDGVVSFVAAPTSVLILLSIGYDLVLRDIPWGKVLRSVLIRLVIMLLCMAGVSKLFGALFAGDTMLIRAVWVMFILPPPYVLPVFTEDESQRTYISSTLTVDTLLSIVCFAVLAVIS